MAISACNIELCLPQVDDVLATKVKPGEGLEVLRGRASVRASLCQDDVVLVVLEDVAVVDESIAVVGVHVDAVEEAGQIEIFLLFNVLLA